MNIPNSLSCLRGVLAFFFLSENTLIRAIAVVFAILTDVFDGYLARNLKKTTQLGIILDPIMDKFFVIFCLGVLISEKHLNLLECIIIISRDLMLCIFWLYLKLANLWKDYKIQPFICGKIITSLQFATLMLIIFHFSIPIYIYSIFIILAPFSLLELYCKQSKHKFNL